jgi:hypothetical protein
MLALTVRTARAAKVTAGVQLPGGDGQQVSSSGAVDGIHPLTLLLPLGTVKGGAAVQVQVRITSAEGVVETQTLKVTV